jgi:hypothetical protein
VGRPAQHHPGQSSRRQDALSPALPHPTRATALGDRPQFHSGSHGAGSQFRARARHAGHRPPSAVHGRPQIRRHELSCAVTDQELAAQMLEHGVRTALALLKPES